MNLHYRILSVDDALFRVAVRYWTDVVSEQDLASDPHDQTDPPVRCRSDIFIDLWRDTTEQELHQIIVKHAPVRFLVRFERIKINGDSFTRSLGLAQSLAGATFTRGVAVQGGRREPDPEDLARSAIAPSMGRLQGNDITYLYYRILSIDGTGMTVRYYTDKIGERDLRSDPGDQTDPPVRCRTDFHLDLDRVDMTEDEINDIIVNAAPVRWLLLEEAKSTGRLTKTLKAAEKLIGPPVRHDIVRGMIDRESKLVMSDDVL